MRRVWAERLGVLAQVFDADEPVFVDRPDLTAAVVVRLGGTTVVAAPDPALSALQRLAREQLLDVGSLLVALNSLGPSVLGVASLSFVDRRTISPVVDGVVRVATGQTWRRSSRGVRTRERAESGLAQMSMCWVASGLARELAAVAGYEVWGDGLAHIGLAVVPGCRGQGLGALAGTVAAVHATGSGLVPQWRCRLDNLPSAGVAERIGFVRFGEQVARSTSLQLTRKTRTQSGEDRGEHTRGRGHGVLVVPGCQATSRVERLKACSTMMRCL